MKYLVTGVAGFIGFHVAEALIKRGDSVVGVDNLNDYYDVNLKKSRLEILKKNKTFKFEKADISDYSAMDEIAKQGNFDKICHLAAQAGVRHSLDHPFDYETSNAKGTLVIFEIARHHNITDVVFASSASVYGTNDIPFSEDQEVITPISLYGATKKYTELVAHAYNHLYGINFTGLRFFSAYGPWGRPDMALFIFTKNICEGKPIDLFNHGNMKRAFTYIDDVVTGVIAAIDNPFPYEIINIGGGEMIELKKFIELIEKELGKKAIMNLVDMQAGDIPAASADLKRSKELLGYEPKTSIEEGIKNFIAWYKEYYNV